MDKVKITLISALIICFTEIANAQNSNQVTCEVTPDTLFLATKVLKNDVKNKAVKIAFDSTTQSVSLQIDITKIKIADIDIKLRKKGYTLTQEEEDLNVEQPAETRQQMPTEKYDLEIDKFLNREDVTIFKDNNYDLLDDSQIHPRSRIYYQMIKNIRTLDGMLSNLNYTTIRYDLEEMRELIDKINDKETSPKELLPNPLLDYYKSLVKQYGDIYDNIYSSE